VSQIIRRKSDHLVMYFGADLTADEITNLGDGWCDARVTPALAEVVTVTSLPAGILPDCWTYDAGVWTVVAGKQEQVDERILLSRATAPSLSASDITIGSTVLVDGSVLSFLDIAWGAVAKVVSYELQYRVSSTAQWNTHVVMPSGDDTEITRINISVLSTQYDFRLRAECLSGTTVWATATKYLPPLVSNIPNVSGLEIFGQGLNTVFVGKDIKLAWRKVAPRELTTVPVDAGINPPLDWYWFRYYEILVYSSTGALLRTEFVAGEQYIYDYEKNYVDNTGVPSRNLTFEIRAVAIWGDKSATPATLTVSNAAPAAIEATVTGGVESVDVRLSIAPELDLAGYVLYAVPTTDLVAGNFTPSALNQKYKGVANKLTLQLTAGEWAFKAAAYDGFGDTTLNYTAILTCTVIDSVENMLSKLTNQITNSQLDADLKAKMDTVGTLSGQYGTIVDANTAAQEAELARAAAVLAQQGAESAALDADNHKVAAELAATNAGSAASAAVGYRDTAYTYRQDASTYAGAAQQSAVSAQTEAGLALGYKNTTVSASNTATQAVIDAGIHVQNAQGYATAAQQYSIDANNAAGTITAQYTIKVDVNGKIAGIGLWSSGVTSVVEILADRFAIVGPGASATALVPFVVDDGIVYMSNAAIKDGTITNAKIGNYIQSDNYVLGESGWKIDKNGTFQLMGGDFFGTVHFTSAPKNAAGQEIEVDNSAIVVGGRNVLTNSNFASGYVPWILYNNGPEAASLELIEGGGREGTNALRVSFTSNTSSKGIIYYANLGWQTETTYTISFYAKTGSITAAVNTFLGWGVAPIEIIPVSNPTINTSWQRYVFVVTWGVNVDSYGPYISVNGNASGYVDFSCVMVEEGNKASAWSISQQDLKKYTDDAKAAAQTYADAKAESERVIAEAYADGIVTAEEQRAIQDATNKANAALAAAQAYADPALTKTNDWARPEDTTKIDGGKIYADAIYVDTAVIAGEAVSVQRYASIATNFYNGVKSLLNPALVTYYSFTVRHSTYYNITTFVDKNGSVSGDEFYYYEIRMDGVTVDSHAYGAVAALLGGNAVSNRVYLSAGTHTVALYANIALFSGAKEIVKVVFSIEGTVK